MIVVDIMMGGGIQHRGVEVSIGRLTSDRSELLKSLLPLFILAIESLLLIYG